MSEPTPTRNWFQLTRLEQIAEHHRLWGNCGFPNDGYTAGWDDVRLLLDQCAASQQLIHQLMEALAVMLEIVEEEGHADNYVPQVAAAREALAAAGKTQG